MCLIRKKEQTIPERPPNTHAEAWT